MKKITILSIAILALSLASCKKERTCTCTTTQSNGDKYIYTFKGKSTKKQGDTWCTGAQSPTVTYNNTNMTVTNPPSCVLS